MSTLSTSAGLEIDIPGPDGTLNAWRFKPAGDGPYPAVLLLMDAPGIRPALHDMAQRIAEQGYLVLMPNLYYRIGRDVQVGPTRNHPDAERNLERMLKYIQTLTNAMVVRDVATVLDRIAGDAAWNRRPVGLTGYCMSGRFAVMAAAAFPNRVACAASYFGTRLLTDQPDSPHLVMTTCRAELYFSFAQQDHYAPPELIEKLSKHLASSSTRYRIEIYPDTEHGFVFPDRGSYQDAGAQRHWQSLFDLLQRNLKQAA